jgi:hypothetical protein
MTERLENIAKDYVTQAGSMFQKGAAITSLILEQQGNTAENPIIFAIGGDAPSTVSMQFQDDIADCYITKLWVGEDGKVYADLFAYYIQEDMENVCLNDDGGTDWATIIDFLVLGTLPKTYIISLTIKNKKHYESK